MTYYRIKNELQTAVGNSWRQMAEELFVSAAGNYGKVVRLIFFSAMADNEEYQMRKKSLERLSAIYFQSPRPLVSLVAQKPLTADLLLEVHSVASEAAVEEVPVSFGHYLRIETEEYKEVLGGALCADDLTLPVREQSEIAFGRMEEILKGEKLTFGDIVRQWNYLERITDMSVGNQCYQDFNDIRSSFYATSDWTFGYPAATGIGTDFGGIQIDFNAIKGNIGITPLDNDWQRAAHVYSEDVLISNLPDLTKETPKFERGKQLEDDTYRMIYISGTAAILGENSVEVGILKQTEITLKNIQHLIGLEEGMDKLSCQSDALQLLRVYLKNGEDVTVVQKELNKYCPSIPVAYLQGDVCREELLIEIEGIACLPCQS